MTLFFHPEHDLIPKTGFAGHHDLILGCFEKRACRPVPRCKGGQNMSKNGMGATFCVMGLILKNKVTGARARARGRAPIPIFSVKRIRSSGGGHHDLLLSDKVH